MVRPERICTACWLPHLTPDWYTVEPYHPRAGQIECAPAHERRIPLEVRDFGERSPPANSKKRKPRSQPSLSELLAPDC